MASSLVQPQHPNPSGDCSDPGFSSSLCLQHRVPVATDDDDPFALMIAYRDVEDDPVDYETICPGQRFTEEQQEQITSNWIIKWSDLCVQFSDSCDLALSRGGEDAPLPPGPLKVLPETTYSCITRGYCYHREYMTADTSQTRSVLGSCRPQNMMQIFSLRLSSYRSESYPISLYGIFAVRDDLEPLRNYVFNCSRDNPVMLDQVSKTLPLCSPCRGIYVLDRVLLEVDLWVKNEGDGSMDEQIVSAYVEIDVGSSFDEMFTGRIHTEDSIWDMDYMFLEDSIEAVIQGFTVVGSPYHLRFVASCRSFDEEIVLFEGKSAMKGKIFNHVLAVKADEQLNVCLEWNGLTLKWTFQNGTLGALSSPDDIPFSVRVFFAPKNLEPRTSRYLAWKERCGRKGRKFAVVS